MQIQFKSPKDLFLFVIELDNLVVNFMWKLKANDNQGGDGGWMTCPVRYQDL